MSELAPLTDREERFVQEYLKDQRASAAARRAGVPIASARSFACRALQRPEIAMRIAVLQNEHRKRISLDTEDLLDRLARIVKADPRELIEFRRCNCRHCWGEGFRHQYTDAELRMARARHARDVKRAQAEGRDLTEDVPLEFDPEGGGGFNANNDPNPECPECNGDGVGVPFLKDTRELSPEAAALFAGLKITKDGVEVKTHDPMRAIELIGKHLGTFADNVNVKGQLTVTQLARRMRDRGPLA